MALITVKPTSPGRRAMVRVSTPGLHKGASVRAADRVAVEDRRTQPLRPHHDAAQGRRFQAALPHHRLQARQGRHRLPRRAHRVRSEPHGAHRAAAATSTASAATSSRRRASKVGDQLMAGRDAPIKTGNSLPLRNIPIGSTVHCIEMKPGKGAQIARSAGASAQLVAREGGYATLRLRSGEMRKVPADCRATIGEVGNSEHNLRKLGKAGAKRWRGIRPTVRGAAMNPVDHPHGGGEGRAGQGNPHPVSPWGQPSQGLQDPQEQAHHAVHRARSSRLIGQHNGTFTEERSVRRSAPAEEGGSGGRPATPSVRSRPGRVVR